MTELWLPFALQRPCALECAGVPLPAAPSLHPHPATPYLPRLPFHARSRH